MSFGYRLRRWRLLSLLFSVCWYISYYKYRASKQSADYEPPHIEGNPIVETIIVGIPVLIIIFLSIVTVKSTYEVEATPKGYEDQKPLVVYASSSDWKWHFSYPEEDIETVNYLYIPTDRPWNLDFTHMDRLQVSGFHNLADKNMRCLTW